MSDKAKLKHVHTLIKQKFNDKKLVFGHGFVDAKIVFVSETIGPEEEKDGKPISGLHGKLLNKLLKSVGIDKRKVYITNVVKYSPEIDIQPSPKEIKSHSAFLREELRTINPDLVITLGNLALNGVGLRQPIENAHGRVFYLGSYELLPTFHPKSALKDPQTKTLLESDFEKIKGLLASKA